MEQFNIIAALVKQEGSSVLTILFIVGVGIKWIWDNFISKNYVSNKELQTQLSALELKSSNLYIQVKNNEGTMNTHIRESGDNVQKLNTLEAAQLQINNHVKENFDLIRKDGDRMRETVINVFEQIDYIKKLFIEQGKK